MSQDAVIRAFFYARFHDNKGPRVVHQVPEGSIIPCPPSPTAMKAPLFDFGAISSYLIPNREFCNRPLSVCTSGFRIIGHPICITDPSKYERNDFIFNFCVVLDEDSDWTAIKTVVSKLSLIFCNLEEQDHFLSKEEQNDTILEAGTAGYGGEKGSKVFAVVEMVYEDLRAVGEAMIPIDEFNTLNLSLFPTRPSPPQILNHHVPLSLARFTSLQTSAWDLTVQRIIPHINGVNSVSHIAQLADVDIALARRAIQHLVYYDCLLLLDVFSFSAVYAPTPLIRDFVTSPEMQDECRHYVHVGEQVAHSLVGSLGEAKVKHQSKSSQLSTSTTAQSTTDSSTTLPSRMALIDLYTSLRHSLSLKDFVLSRLPQFRNIDIRRWITFGIIKGLLYRVHRYAVLPSTPISTSNEATIDRIPELSEKEKKGEGTGLAVRLARERTMAQLKLDDKDPTERRNSSIKVEEAEAAYKLAALSSGWRLSNDKQKTDGQNTPSTDPSVMQNGAIPRLPGKIKEGDDMMVSAGTSTALKKKDRDMLRYADGLHCFDEICTALKMSESAVMERFKALGEVGDGMVFLWK